MQISEHQFQELSKLIFELRELSELENEIEEFYSDGLYLNNDISFSNNKEWYNQKDESSESNLGKVCLIPAKKLLNLDFYYVLLNYISHRKTNIYSELRKKYKINIS